MTTACKVLSIPNAQKDVTPLDLGDFHEYNGALTKAAEWVMFNLYDLHKPGQSAKELFDCWLENGESASIVPDIANPFSSINFARLIVTQITSDYSHPQVLEVSCEDRLNFPSGGASPPKSWKFYLRTPATFDSSEETLGLIKRAMDVMYEDMSRQAMTSEGSSYTLLKMTVTPLSPEEASVLIADASSKFLYVQRDGSISSKLPNPNG